MKGLYNAALNRPVFSSSVLLNYHKKYNFVPSLANDGSRETDMHGGETGACFHSKREDHPWWAVDLGQPMFIYGVNFTNRGDCCGMTKSVPAFVIVALVDPSQLTGAFAQSRRTQNSNIESFCSNAALLLYHSITDMKRRSYHFLLIFAFFGPLSSTLRLRFVILMTDAWRFKRCIIIIMMG